MIFGVVAANGPCRLKVNIGGYPFKLYSKELALGLIW